MQRMKKKGNVFFLWLVVFLATASLFSFYIKFNSIMNHSNEYLIGNKLQNTYASFSSMASSLNYFDVASDLAGNDVAMELGTNLDGGFLTKSSLLLVKQNVNIKPVLKNSFSKLFEKSFMKYSDKFPSSESDMKIPRDFEYYFFKDKFHIVSYDEISIGSRDLKMKIKPSFEIESPINISEINQDYENAKMLDTNCRDENDYENCIAQGAKAMGWENISLREMPMLNSFMENWFNCVETSDTNCSCTFDMAQDNDWLDITENGFKVLKGEKAIDVKAVPMDVGLCNVYNNKIHDRDEIRLKKKDDKMHIKIKGTDDQMTGNTDLTEKSYSGNKVELVVYKDTEGKKKACILTKGEKETPFTISTPGGGLLGNPINEVNIKGECKPKHERVYVRVNSSREISVLDGGDIVKKSPAFYFVFEK